MGDNDYHYNDRLLREAVAAANDSGRPLFLVALATKPCYIKLAGLAKALAGQDVPHLLLDVGQHYEPLLTGAREEFSYDHLIAIHLQIRGGMLERTADMALKLKLLALELRRRGLRTPPIPVVSGDTSTAAFLPLFWYLLTGYRSVHVEAGLRSSGPAARWEWRGLEQLLSQRQAPWLKDRDTPFPEAFDTTVASTACDLLLAPVQRNADNLLNEGYDPAKMVVVGSLSADAVSLASGVAAPQASPQLEELKEGRWLRVDIHRRENMTPLRLTAILRGLSRFAGSGGKLVLVMSNALRTAIERHNLHDLLRRLQRCEGVLVQDLWPSYFHVISFLKSPNCLAIFTDSGGLQEEANILGVPCITCRFSTDRPETVLDGETNILLPPADEELIAAGLESILSARPERVFAGLPDSNLYGERVGERITTELSRYAPPPPAAGAEITI